ncbi:hypothetical protein OBBRIDRAFT_823204 [Obba rivulosa]|uniref:Uncharacterized protein n=1 Tax=Obba rivulosa TaxID=1052685 RepID=A0A8E2DSJ2_9APHY|nr:hypothetical protein OBBRIDRAFT_823204 [Obba rivulosa]
MDGPCPAQGVGCCSRVMWREIRKNRRLRKWDSLPLVRLRPHDRPLFECRGCGFSNVFGALCPWCCCVCQATGESSVKQSLRRKQLSSPSLLSEAQKVQLAKLEKRMRSSRHRKPTPRSNGSTTGEPSRGPPVQLQTPEKVRRKKRRYGTIYSTTDFILTATTLSVSRSVSQEESAIDGSTGDFSIPVPSLTTSTITFDVAYTEISTDGIKTPSLNSSDVTPQRSLRRKRKMSTLRRQPSCSLRRRSTTMEPPDSAIVNHTVDHTPHSSCTRPTSTSSSCPTSHRSILPVPLGHPSRPLYSAIRANMSLPPTPDESLPQPDNISSQSSTLHERLTRSLDIPHPPPRGRYDFTLSSFHQSPFLLTSGATMGCSVSGEAELHMDLARSRSMDGVPPAYKFQRMKRTGTVRANLETIGKGLRDLLGKA